MRGEVHICCCFTDGSGGCVRIQWAISEGAVPFPILSCGLGMCCLQFAAPQVSFAAWWLPTRIFVQISVWDSAGALPGLLFRIATVPPKPRVLCLGGALANFEFVNLCSVLEPDTLLGRLGIKK